MFTSDEDKEILVIEKIGNPHEEEMEEKNE